MKEVSREELEKEHKETIAEIRRLESNMKEAEKKLEEDNSDWGSPSLARSIDEYEHILIALAWKRLDIEELLETGASSFMVEDGFV